MRGVLVPKLTPRSCVARAPISGHPEVEEIVQQPAYKAFIHLAQFRFEARFKTWLIRIGLNEARQWRRKHAALRLIEFTPPAFSELSISDQPPSPVIQYQKNQSHALLGDPPARHPEN